MTRPTILYIDDEPINLKLFELSFNRSLNVISATSGEEGLNKIKHNRDILAVISDLKMPKMDGLEFVRILKSIYKIDIPCYILSGGYQSKEIQEAINNKLIEKYFQKPMDKSDILMSLEEQLVFA